MLAVDQYDLALAVLGLALLGAAVVPRLLAERPLSLPIVYLGLGFAFFALPLGLPDPDPIANGAAAERLTEVTVIISLMGVGLKLDRPIGWRSWSPTWRLLGITMPLSIAAVALLGWWAGLLPATALLVGAVLAPTDPVLASDVQVAPPGEGDAGDTRFALTSEAGLQRRPRLPVHQRRPRRRRCRIGGLDRRVGRRGRRREAAGRPRGRRPRRSGPRLAGLPHPRRREPGRDDRGLRRRGRHPRSPTGSPSWPTATGSSPCSWPPSRCGPPSGTTSTTVSCTGSPTPSSSCSPSSCWSWSAAPWPVGRSARSPRPSPPSASPRSSSSARSSAGSAWSAPAWTRPTGPPSRSSASGGWARSTTRPTPPRRPISRAWTPSGR